MTPRVFGKLAAPVVVLSVLLLIVAIGSAWYVRKLQQSVSQLLAHNVASVRAAQELEISIREISTQFNRYLITQDDSFLKPIPRLKQRTADALQDAEQAATTQQEQLLMKRTRHGYEHFFEEYDRIFREREQWKYGKIIELIDTVLQKEILEPAHEYLRVNEGMLTRVSETNQELADRLTTGLVALGLCGSIAGLLGGVVIASAIRRSILQTEQQVRTTAEQLTQAVPKSETPSSSPTSQTALEQMTRSASAVLTRLRQTERDALRAEQLAWVGQMAAGIAHEIRNPLMSIKLLVQATAERPRGPRFQSQDLHVLEEEIIRLEQIVSGFLDFARPARLEPRPVNVQELIERTLDSVRSRADLQGVRIQMMPSAETVMVSADANQLRQIVFNLLFNSLDAQPQGGFIRISVERTTQEKLNILIEDGGPGVPSEIRDRIFEPFVSTKETGVGLGLSICRRIAESHGGSLVLRTDRLDTTFQLQLPAMPMNGDLRSAPAAETLSPG